MNTLEITGLAKSGGPLTKRINLAPDGTLHSDGSACRMSAGAACRLRFTSLHDFADCIGSLDQHEAIALGALRPDLPARVRITTQARLAKLNGTHPADLVARTADYIKYRPQQPALVLLDFDTKGMPSVVYEKILQAGGVWPALVSVIPELASVGRVHRRSTSAGIRRVDTGQHLRGSDGLHVFILINDGEDAERFLRTLHCRCWLHDFGWLMVGAGGQLLERSIIDRMVYAPERVVFEGSPVLEYPLEQDIVSRQPTVEEGEPLDTVAVCLPLTIVEQARFKELYAREAQRLAPDAARAREQTITELSARLSGRSGMSLEKARHVATRQCVGVLLPNVELMFDDSELAGFTVADVLSDPDRFVDATLADPLEGPEYGRCKAKVMRGADGTLWINSFAHGRTIYELRYDADMIQAAVEKAHQNEAPRLFTHLVTRADLDIIEIEALRNLVSKRSGVGRRALDASLKQARQEQEKQRQQEVRIRQAAERRDPRPQILAPTADAPWLPVLGVLNEVLGSSRLPEPPARDIDGVMVEVRTRRMPDMHALTAHGSNKEESEEARLPAPEQPLVTRLTEAQTGELIEQHVEYVSRKDWHPVHLGEPFVRHFHTRSDNALPIIAAVATLPIVLADGTLLGERGLHRDRGIVFRVPPKLLSMLPKQEDCTATAVAEAMRFLTDEYLCDVATDYIGKCILIAIALTIIERSLLPDRPAFFVTAGRRGGGKTTTLIMLLMAVTGVRPPAAAWSSNEEERRKALLAYLLAGLPAIIWDNIRRGEQISCPHIEASCTTAFYSDRRLGVSEMIAVAASVIHLFTGNNIGPRGDLASRTLSARLVVERADPENRSFRHPDPIAWTEDNRSQILRALYTILLGNPALRSGSNVVPETRFKTWWLLVGSAIEHAAQQHTDHVAALVMDASATCKPERVSFKDLFISQEKDDEESASLSEALTALASKWPYGVGFTAASVARVINEQGEFPLGAEREQSATLREFLFPNVPAYFVATAKATSKRLKKHVGEPVRAGARTLILTESRDAHSEVISYHVKEI